jgi:hypothetical protein
VNMQPEDYNIKNSPSRTAKRAKRASHAVQGKQPTTIEGWYIPFVVVRLDNIQ